MQPMPDAQSRMMLGTTGALLAIGLLPAYRRARIVPGPMSLGPHAIAQRLFETASEMHSHGVGTHFPKSMACPKATLYAEPSDRQAWGPWQNICG